MMIRITAIAILAVATVAVFGELDYQSAVEEQERRCAMLEAWQADSHLPPIDRKGWPEAYPGQYKSECGE